MTLGEKSMTWLQRLVWIVFGIVLLQGMFGVPHYAWALLFPEHYSAVGVVAGAVTASVGVYLALRYGALIEAIADRWVGTLSHIPARTWLAGVLIVGIVIRIGWLLLYPPDVQVSDHATYSELAQKLVRGEPYYTGNTYAYWPPGYPFFLAAGYWLFGVHPWVIGLGNLVLYAGTSVVTWHLGKAMSGESAARVATALIALWPNLVISTSLAKKELLLVLLIPLALLFYLLARSARTRRGAMLFSLSSGASLGAACLTQPSFMLFPAVFLFFEYLGRRPVLATFARIALLVAGMVVVIAPWTIRNYEVLNAFVPIATTGGNNFYSANNALATGSYIPKYERDLDQFDELTQNRLGYEWGKQWIRENPGRFLELALGKQIALMSDDSEGAYWVMKAGRKIGDFRFIALKGGSNAFWLMVVWLMFAAIVVHRLPDSNLPHPHPATLIMLSLLYVWAIDSVFQSGARHHMPLVAALAVLVGMLAREGGPERRTRPATPRSGAVT